MSSPMPLTGMGAMLSPPPSTPEPASETALAPQSAAQAELPSAKKLVVDAARINTLLKDLAEQFPELSPAVDVALQSLREGVVKATLGMQSPPQAEGGQPLYG